MCDIEEHHATPFLSYSAEINAFDTAKMCINKKYLGPISCECVCVVLCD